ncbi:MAG: hypothetical protein Q7R30_07905 [Acidobacteriota bacterium]|nr:hypothetical protein [Acidobacteriota bacterium]
MISRREVVTAGVLGTLSNAAMAAPVDAQSGQGDIGVQTNLNQIRNELRDMKAILEDGMRRSSLGFGGIGLIRDKLTLHLRSSGKFPDLCEIGTALFYEVYDWHVKHSQQIQIVRIADQRFAIQFMFTQLVVRWENDPNYLGQPYDRG